MNDPFDTDIGEGGETVPRDYEGEARPYKAAATGPVPGKWSVYDAAGKLCAAGYANRGAAETYAPPSERDKYKFVFETSVGDLGAYTGHQELILAVINRPGAKLSMNRVGAIMDGISHADSHLNNVDVPTYSELLLAVSNLVAFIDSVGLERMPAFDGMNIKPIATARELVKKAGLS